MTASRNRTPSTFTNVLTDHPTPMLPPGRDLLDRILDYEVSRSNREHFVNIDNRHEVDYAVRWNAEDARAEHHAEQGLLQSFGYIERTLDHRPEYGNPATLQQVLDAVKDEFTRLAMNGTREDNDPKRKGTEEIMSALCEITRDMLTSRGSDRRLPKHMTAFRGGI